MSVHTVVSVLGSTNLSGRMKEVVFTMTGSASYDAGGSIVDLSTAGVLAVADGFTSVHGVECIESAAANAKHVFRYVRVAAATGLLKILDVEQATPAEASGNLSANTYTMKAIGY
jgi:hypothetical protein